MPPRDLVMSFRSHRCLIDYPSRHMRLDKQEGVEQKLLPLYAYFGNHCRAGAPVNLLQLLEIRGEITDAQKNAMARSARHGRKKPARKLTDFS